jgi:hypothetical protein
MKPELSRTEDHIIHAHGRISDLEHRLEGAVRELHKLSARLDSLLIATHTGLRKKPVKAKKTYRTKL